MSNPPPMTDQQERALASVVSRAVMKGARQPNGFLHAIDETWQAVAAAGYRPREDRDELLATIERLRLALVDAADELESFNSYVEPYFREKWGHAEVIANVRKVAASVETFKPEPGEYNRGHDAGRKSAEFDQWADQRDNNGDGIARYKKLVAALKAIAAREIIRRSASTDEETKARHAYAAEALTQALATVGEQ